MTAIAVERVDRDAINAKQAARIPPVCKAFPTAIEGRAKTLRFLVAAGFTDSRFKLSFVRRIVPVNSNRRQQGWGAFTTASCQQPERRAATTLVSAHQDERGIRNAQARSRKRQHLLPCFADVLLALDCGTFWRQHDGVIGEKGQRFLKIFGLSGFAPARRSRSDRCFVPSHSLLQYSLAFLVGRAALRQHPAEVTATSKTQTSPKIVQRRCMKSSA